jgi:hypothetical protein
MRCARIAPLLPLLPPEPPKPKSGRPRVSDRAALDSASWLNRSRRLKIRYEHRADSHPALLPLGSLAAPSSPCVSSFSANHVQLARTVGLDLGPPRTASAILGT